MAAHAVTVEQHVAHVVRHGGMFLNAHVLRVPAKPLHLLDHRFALQQFDESPTSVGIELPYRGYFAVLVRSFNG